MVEQLDPYSTEDPPPDADARPLSEVAIGIQFKPLDNMTGAHLGLFWRNLRARYPKSQVHAPLGRVSVPSAVGPTPPTALQFSDAPWPFRCWYITEDDSELVQLQHDRIVHNWRKRGPKYTYRRFARLRDDFAAEYMAFSDFAREEGLGEIVPDSCEVTYINNIPCPDLGRLEAYFTFWKQTESTFLPAVAHAQFSMSYVIHDDGGQPAGRLEISAQPAFLKRDNAPVIALHISAMGAPEGAPTLDGALAFLNRGRNWAWQAFNEVTTPAVHAAPWKGVRGES